VTPKWHKHYYSQPRPDPAFSGEDGLQRGCQG
jgi:hypothetical protein